MRSCPSGTAPVFRAWAFFVSKKNGKLRLIVDARVANSFFRSPPTGETGSASNIADLKLGPDQQVYGSSYDVRDFFYRRMAPWEIAKHFGPPGLNRGEAESIFGAELAKGAAIDDNALYHPYVQALAMGFSWAFYLAQSMLQAVARQCLPSIRLLMDHCSAPDLDAPGPVALLNADNGTHLALNAAQCNQERALVQKELERVELATHEVEQASTRFSPSGVSVDGCAGTVRPTAARVGKLRFALGRLINRRPTTGEELEIILGQRVQPNCRRGGRPRSLALAGAGEAPHSAAPTGKAKYEPEPSSRTAAFPRLAEALPRRVPSSRKEARFGFDGRYTAPATTWRALQRCGLKTTNAPRGDATRKMELPQLSENLRATRAASERCQKDPCENFNELKGSAEKISKNCF